MPVPDPADVIDAFRETRAFFGNDAPFVPAHHHREFCPIPNSHGVGPATAEFQKLVESGTVRKTTV